MKERGGKREHERKKEERRAEKEEQSGRGVNEEHQWNGSREMFETFLEREDFLVSVKSLPSCKTSLRVQL